MRRLAQTALDVYGFSSFHFKFLRQSGNSLFRVQAIDPVGFIQDERYNPGQYLLRVHQPGYQTSQAIKLELAWLASLSQEAHLPVQEPVRNLEGELLSRVAITEIPGQYDCSLLRWLKGRHIKEGIQPKHFRLQGELMAHLHNHASHWKFPPCLTKRNYDWSGLFGDQAGLGIPAEEAWSLLPHETLDPYRDVARQTRQLMKTWGKGADVYGLIHADLGLDANVLFQGEEARAIDFDDSGFGYYMYDLSLALEHCQEDEALPVYRQSLLEGYGKYRRLPNDPLKVLDLFLAAFCVYLSLWAVAGTKTHPKYREELITRMERAFRLVKRILPNI